MTSYASRREFLSLIGLLPLIGASLGKFSALKERPVKAILDAKFYCQSLGIGECHVCCGLGKVPCLACDGTGLWTAQSALADRYKREWAQRTGQCAWCNEWGEAECDECGGRGVSVLV
jgi:hypothetical protein